MLDVHPLSYEKSWTIRAGTIRIFMFADKQINDDGTIRDYRGGDRK